MNTASFESIAVLGLLITLVPVVGILMAITPYLMPKHECFTVTIPDSAARDPYLMHLKRIFCAIILCATLLLTALAVFLLTGNFEQGFITCIIISTLVLAVGGYILMLAFRRKVQHYKKEQGWQATTQQNVSFVGEEPTPKPISLKWDLLFLPALVITIAMAVVSYPAMPNIVPLQIDFSGAVTTTAEKSPLVAAFPAMVVLFISICMVFSHWTIVRSKRGIDASRPALSAWAYGSFARAQSILIVTIGTLLSFLGPLIELTLIGTIRIQDIVGPVLILIMIIMVASCAVSIVYGQNGSRLLARMNEPSTMAKDDDQYWKLGIFYWNPEDASLFLPERFGIGWTVNFARPLIWVILAVFILVTMGFVTFSLSL